MKHDHRFEAATRSLLWPALCEAGAIVADAMTLAAIPLYAIGAAGVLFWWLA
jgi:hypothetical protein